MTGLCPNCGHATEVQHISRTRIAVEFCARCNVALGELQPGQAQVFRLRDGAHRDAPADPEFTHEALAIARDGLPKRIAPGSRPAVAHSEPVTTAPPAEPTRP